MLRYNIHTILVSNVQYNALVFVCIYSKVIMPINVFDISIQLKKIIPTYFWEDTLSPNKVHLCVPRSHNSINWIIELFRILAWFRIKAMFSNWGETWRTFNELLYPNPPLDLGELSLPHLVLLKNTELSLDAVLSLLLFLFILFHCSPWGNKHTSNSFPPVFLPGLIRSTPASSMWLCF